MKRTRLTNEQKLKIIDELKAEIIDKTEAMQKYNISRGALWEMLKNEKSLREFGANNKMKNRKASTGPHDAMLEENLLTWLHQTRKLGVPINGPMIQQKALNIYDTLEAEAQNRDIIKPKGKDRKFMASDGWLTRFKKRHGIKLMSKEEILPSDIEEAAIFQEESKGSSTSAEETVLFPDTEAVFIKEEPEGSSPSSENAAQCFDALSWLETQKEIDISDQDLIVVRRLRKLVLGHVALETCAQNIFNNL